MTIIRRPLRLKPRYALAGIIVALSLCLASTFRMLRASYALGFRNAKARPLRIYDRYFGYHSAMTDLVIPGALGPVQLRVYTPIGDTHPLPINFDRTVRDNGTKEIRTNPRDRKKLNELQTADTPQMHQLYLDSLTRHHAEMEAISPISVLHNINVPLYILHGQDDPVFPEGEVEWMRKELAGNRNAHILVSPWIAHAFVGQPATQGERLRVINFGAQLLYEASRPSPIAH